MNLNKPYIVWDENSRADLESIEEMDSIVDTILQQAQNELPISAQISVADDSSLLITIGGEVSHLEFYSHAGGPLVVGSRGSWDDDTLIAFTHGGEYSEIELRYCVPFAQAKEALREYFLTGRRPTNIQWNDDL